METYLYKIKCYEFFDMPYDKNIFLDNIDVPLEGIDLLIDVLDMIDYDNHLDVLCRNLQKNSILNILDNDMIKNIQNTFYFIIYDNNCFKICNLNTNNIINKINYITSSSYYLNFLIDNNNNYIITLHSEFITIHDLKMGNIVNKIKLDYPYVGARPNNQITFSLCNKYLITIINYNLVVFEYPQLVIKANVFEKFWKGDQYIPHIKINNEKFFVIYNYDNIHIIDINSENIIFSKKIDHCYQKIEILDNDNIVINFINQYNRGGKTYYKNKIQIYNFKSNKKNNFHICDESLDHDSNIKTLKINSRNIFVFDAKYIIIYDCNGNMITKHEYNINNLINIDSKITYSKIYISNNGSKIIIISSDTQKSFIFDNGILSYNGDINIQNNNHVDYFIGILDNYYQLY